MGREYKAGTKKKKGSAIGRVTSNSHNALTYFWSVFCSRHYLLVFYRKKCRWCQYRPLTTCANNNSQNTIRKILQHFKNKETSLRALEIISNVHILWPEKEAKDYYFHFLIWSLITDRIESSKIWSAVELHRERKPTDSQMRALHVAGSWVWEPAMDILEIKSNMTIFTGW